MYSLPFTIKTLSPVVLAKQSGDKVLTETNTYFSGNILRGVLANQYIKKQGLKKNAHQDTLFQRWFLSGQLRFLPSYPIAVTKDKMLSTVPIPRCLYQDKDGNKVIDVSTGKKAQGFKSMRGFVAMECKDTTIQLYKIEPTKRIRFHLVRNLPETRVAGTSEQDGIFNYEALDDGQLFGGSIVGSQQDLLAFQQAFASELVVNIGRSKHVQYGQCLLSFGKVEKITLDAFVDEIEEDDSIRLVCHTPLLLANSWGTIEPSVGLLAVHLGILLGSEVVVNDSFVTVEEIEQFVGIRGMKNQRERAIAAGSVISISIKDGWTIEKIEKLSQLLYAGIGCRQVEGFGQLRIMQAYKGYTVNELSKSKIQKPTGTVPTIMKEMLTDMIKDKLQYDVRTQAVDDANQYLTSSLNTEVGTSLVSKLESTLKEAQSAKQFMELVSGYQDEASKKLRRLRGIKGSLYNILTTNEKPYNTNKIERLASSLESIANVVDWNPVTDEIFQEQLFRNYWHSFFRHMRKGLKVVPKGGAIDG